MDRSPEQMIESLRRRLTVQTATTHVLAESLSLEDAVPILLAQLGSGLGWEVGAFWEPDAVGTTLTRTAIWQSGHTGAIEFVERDLDRTFAQGEGLPGEVWMRREPRVLTDIAALVNFPRRTLAAACGLRSALAFPVQIQDEFFGVLEFFSVEKREADADVLATMATVGIQLGQFVRRSRTEAARLESESRFRIFAETASDATFTIEPDSTIVYVNPAVERIFGYRPEELLGKSLTLIIPERLRAAHSHGINRYLTTGKRNIPWNAVQLPGLHKDGHEVPLEIAFGEYQRDGKRFFTGIVRNITERVRHQREIETYAERLSKLVRDLEIRSAEAEDASRAKSLFLANMSHEIRTPINAIIGYGELLQMGVAGPLNENQSGYIERVRASAKHLLGLINDVLDLSKIEAGHFTVHNEDGNIAADVEAALSLVRPQAATKSIRLQNDVEAGTDSYVGDVPRVRQILANLLANAVKFTGPGGRVTVTCGRAAEKTATAQLPGSGPWLTVTVEDTGIGIEPDQINAVFRPFVQASTGKTRTHGGTGLGLSISQQLARLMDGEITVQSQPGVGSAFTLWLPVVASGTHAQQLTTDAPGEARSLGLCLIDDAKAIVAYYVQRLRDEPRIPHTMDMESSEIADHLSTLLADWGQALTIVGEVGHDMALLRDSSDIQRLISERHGEQRSRHGWPEAAVRREFEILRDVVSNYLRQQAGAQPVDAALQLLNGLLQNAEQISIQSFRDSLSRV